jgi:hypothetical protein
MKRLVLFISVLFALVASANAQDVDWTKSFTMQSGQTYYEYTGLDGDTLGLSYDSAYIYVYPNKNVPLKYDFAIQTDTTKSAGGTYTIDIDLDGRMFDSDSWTELEANSAVDIDGGQVVTNFGNTSDTAWVYDPSPDAENFYRQFRFRIIENGAAAAGDRIKFEKLYFKFFEQ